MDYSYKSINGSVLDVDDNSRRVKIAISEMGSKDFDNDIIDGGAYNKTIKERGPQGKNKIYHLTDHQANLKSTLGKFSELYVEGNKLVGLNNIVKTAWGNDVLEMYKADIITEHSVGIQVIKKEDGKNGDPRIIKEVKLFEGSAVLLGANENTPTLSVGKSREEQQTEVDKILKALEGLRNLLKNGDISEDAGTMIEIRIMQLETQIKGLFSLLTTSAVDNTQEPAGSKKVSWQNVLLNIQN